MRRLSDWWARTRLQMVKLWDAAVGQAARAGAALRERCRRAIHALAREWSGATTRTARWWARMRLNGPVLLLTAIAVGGVLLLGPATWLTAQKQPEFPYVLFGVGWPTLIWVALAVIILVPRIQASHVRESRLRSEVEDSSRRTALQIVGGAAVLWGGFVAWAQLQSQVAATKQTFEIAQGNLALAREAQRSERYSRAIDQLANGALHIRVGGVLGLERVAEELGREDWPVQELLASFVRASATWRNDSIHRFPVEAEPSRRDPLFSDHREVIPPTDIQVALRVLGYRQWDAPWLRDLAEHSPMHEKDTHVGWIDLSHTDIQGADLTEFMIWALIEREPNEPPRPRVSLQGSHLDRAILAHANLTGANLEAMHAPQSFMRGTSLIRADLEDADLSYSELSNARFEYANLDGAVLRGVRGADTRFHGAYLRGVTFERARLENPDFSGTQLRGNFRNSLLDGPSFFKARFWGAGDFTGAKILNADLRGADFIEAIGLTKEHLKNAQVDASTLLPAYLHPTRPQPGP